MKQKSIYKVTSTALISDTIYIAVDNFSDALNKIEKYKKIKNLSNFNIKSISYFDDIIIDD